MTLFLQYLLSGIGTGCAFALVATGFVVIYRVTRIVNFAQGTFAVLGGMFTAWLVSRGAPNFGAEALAVIGAAAAGALVGWIALGQPGTPPLTSLIVTVGLSVGAYAIFVLLWGDQPVSFGGLIGHLDFGGVRIESQYALIMCASLVAFGALSVFFGHADVGRALTACSENPRAARLMGINTTRAGLVAFAVAGALGGLAGVLLTPLQPVSFNSDVGMAINGFAAAIFGNLVRPVAALCGGLVLGVVQAMVAGYWSSALQSSAALVFMLALLSWQAGRGQEIAA